MRVAVPVRTDRSTCFGLEFRQDKTCRECSERRSCMGLYESWAYCPSLREYASKKSEEARKKLFGVKNDVAALYCNVHAYYYGKAPSIFAVRKSRAWMLHLDNAAFNCENAKIDFVEWTLAQMVGMSKSTVRDFMPNMLVGKNAQRRWEVHLAIQRRQYKRASGISDIPNAAMASLWQRLIAADTKVGSHYVSAVVSGRSLTLKEAAKECNADNLWFSTWVEGEGARGEIAWKAQEKIFSEVSRDIGRANAMVNVVSGLNAALPDHIGVRDGEVTWEGLAELLADVLTEINQRKPVESGLPVIPWSDLWQDDSTRESPKRKRLIAAMRVNSGKNSSVISWP